MQRLSSVAPQFHACAPIAAGGEPTLYTFMVVQQEGKLHETD